MSADPETLLQCIHAAGLVIELDGADLLVLPADKLTEWQYAYLRKHKAVIVEALQSQAANDCQADAASTGTSVPPPKQSLEVCCGDCQHFEPDRIGDGSGIGHCLAGCKARPGVDTPFYPQASRHCGSFQAKRKY